jgi:ABC-type antimicrobial peptide transport system permease subunit
VGLARDAKYTNLRGDVPPTIYLPAYQRVEGQAAFAVRAAGDPAALMPAVRAALRDIDPTLPILDLRTQREQIERLHANERLFAWLSTFFGFTAVALAVTGVHGLLAQAVQRRTGEFGLRLAVGATPTNVGGMIVREAVVLAAIGAAAGIGAAALLARTIAAMLFGVTPTDPLTYGGAALFVVAIAGSASLVAARRASRVEPLVALRQG